MAIRLGGVRFTGDMTKVAMRVASGGGGGGGGSQTKLLMHFDGDLTDSSSNPMTFSATGNAATSATQSKFGGNALYLDGSSSYAAAANNNKIDFGTGDFCVEGWFYFNDATQRAALWSFTDEPHTGSGSTMALLWEGGDLSAWYGQSDGTEWGAIWSRTSTIVSGQWHHIAVVRQSGTATIFVDGVPGGSSPWGSFAGAAFVSSKLLIGQYSDYIPAFGGYIDEFRVTVGQSVYTGNFNVPTRAFDGTDGDLGGATFTGLVTNGLLMNLDAATYSGSGTTWADSTGNGNDVTLVNAPTWNSNGWFEFNGTDQYGTVPTTNLVYGNSPRTLAGWVNVNNINPGDAQFFFAYGNPDVDQAFFAGMNIGMFSAGGYADDMFVGTPQQNTWYFIVATYDSANLKIYVNGSLVANEQHPSLNTISNDARVGSQVSGYGGFLPGLLGQVLMYNRALSDAEVLQNYNATNSRY